MCAYVPTTYLHVPKAVLYSACMNVTVSALLSRCQTLKWRRYILSSTVKLLSLTKGPSQTTASSSFPPVFSLKLHSSTNFNLECIIFKKGYVYSN